MRIVILHAGALGDCVLTIHLARALRGAGHTISLAARSPIAAWAATRGMLDQAIPLDRLAPVLWGTSDPSDLGRPQNLLDSFDAVISCLGGPGDPANSRLIEWLGGPCVIAFDPRPTVETLNMGRHITKQWAEDLCRTAHHVDWNLHDFRGEDSWVKCPAHGHEIRKTVDPNPQDGSGGYANSTTPDHQIARSPDSIIIHPGSGGRDKCCPLVALESLLHRLRQSGANVRWMIGPDEMERDGRSLVERLERIAPVVFNESIEQAADFVASMDAYVGNDSGMTHVAALTGVKTVALFGPTDPHIWRPLGMRCTVHMFPDDKSDTAWVDSVSGLLLDCPIERLRRWWHVSNSMAAIQCLGLPIRNPIPGIVAGVFGCLLRSS